MKKFLILTLFISFIWAFDLHSIKEFFSEENLIYLLKQYGYIILFIWCIFEGETGLVMAGVLSHMGDMNLELAIIVATFGGFSGDQIYFYLGRFNRKWILKELTQHRKKFAKAKLLLKKYGIWVVFIQRFIYGMRTIIPMTIGILNYDAKKFALVNLFSAFVWASVTIIPSYIFGEEILAILKFLKHHWYLGVAFVIILFSFLWYLNKKEED
ncbi:MULTISPECIES: DedA family protein [unclassified Lebetimonas]|uniref:DedA family protein n=1 Tax=unclassified Lebetimonas TaxID=2648158 RepID=UPI000466CE67|nr:MULTISPECIES: DedA family protein [unclassified Lebetimonas]